MDTIFEMINQKQINMVTLNQIQDFLSVKKLAIAGASRNLQKFGGVVFKELSEKGFELYPVNPYADEIQGVKCYKSIEELPADVEHLLILTPKFETESVARSAVSKGIKMIWIQNGAETPEAVKIIERSDVSLISKKCIMMFAEPVKSVHGFHRFFVKTFGKYPKLIYSPN